jgi:flagellar biosynthesis/type III secretory pathway M-ring protein FliF/YscJ
MSAFRTLFFYFALSFCLLAFLWEPWATADPVSEKALEAKIQSQIEALVGPGKAKVTVSGKTKQSQIQSRSLTHRRPQVAHERVVSETAQGVTRSRVERIYTYDDTESLATESAGGLTQKSVSVIYQPPAKEDDPESLAPPLDPALIETIVRTTAQIDPQRGDQLSVRAVQMDTSLYERLKAEMEKARQAPPIWIYLLCAGLGLGGGVGLGFVIARKRQRKAVNWESVQTGAYPLYPNALPEPKAQALELPRA